MIFLCGLFFPVQDLPSYLQPLSMMLPLTYGVDLLHGAINGSAMFSPAFDVLMLLFFITLLFSLSLRSVHRRWIY